MPQSAIKSQHAGAWRNRCSGLLATLPGVPTAAPTVPKNRTQGLPTLTRHQQKANEQCWKPRPGEQAHSTLPAPPVALVSHTLSKGLSHGVKGSTSPGLCWQLALTIPDKTGEAAKGLHKGYPSPAGTDEEVMVWAV